ncbi:N-acyl-D-amino-acid deacylase family protein [Halovenus marina]|uniref:N-acyl-D-amino-acid deacylase family protein n=1 Tax=Halovenus marina TaxID=3396621 RepID=UPI003F5459C7
MSYSLLLKGARVVDGTGAPWFDGTVAVRDGTIERVLSDPDPDLTADTVVDLDGLAVAPGFIDAHSHSDLAPFGGSPFEPKIRQGVTTEVVGQDGLTMAPLDDDRGDEWIQYLRAVVGEADDGPSTWETTEAYLNAIDEAEPPANVAMLAGHGTIRMQVLGMSSATPTESELEEMENLVARSVEAGAVGFSTGLEYFPHRHADTTEVRRLAGQLSDSGLPFVAHIRSYSRDMWTALDEFVDIGASEEIPVHLSHFKLGGDKSGLHDRALELARAARDRGVDFTADLYPWIPGNSILSALLPPWVFDGGTEKMIERLADEETRAQIKGDMEANDGSWDIAWENLIISHVGSSENEHVLGRTLGEIAEKTDTDPFELMCDLLVEEDLEVAIVTLNPAETAEEDIRVVMQDERVALGSDAIMGKHSHPRMYGAYPKILGTYVRELNLLSLEEAVRKMTSLPARIYNFEHKGLVRPGMDADLVVFDPLNVTNRATVDDPHNYPQGIPHVLVDGEFIVRDGERTEATPGRALRS